MTRPVRVCQEPGCPEAALAPSCAAGATVANPALATRTPTTADQAPVTTFKHARARALSL